MHTHVERMHHFPPSFHVKVNYPSLSSSVGCPLPGPQNPICMANIWLHSQAQVPVLPMVAPSEAPGLHVQNGHIHP